MKARGYGFFAAFDTKPYEPRGVLLGQATDDSCGAACVRMLLLDESPDIADDHRFSESFLRGALETTDKGSAIAGVPAVLQEMGSARPYVYRTDVTLDELRIATRLGAAIAILRTILPESGHVVLIEEVMDDRVACVIPYR
jgi:hypothetical protein